METILSTHNLHRRYGGPGAQGYEAVRGVDLEVTRGEVFALLGTNGAGKTSTLEMLEGLARPSQGSVRVFGLDPVAQRAQVRPRTGVVLQEAGYPAQIRTAEMARTWAATLSRPQPVAQVLDAVGLGHRADVEVSSLSGGERRRLDLALALLGNLEIVAEAASGTEGVAVIARHTPDIAVLDLQMPDLDGIEVATRAAVASPGTRCLIVTSHGRPGYLKKALEAGVLGFLPKTAPATALAGAIRTVHAGGRYVDPELAADAIAAGASPLTPREADVLELAADGAPVEEIAARVHLSAGTVRNYLSSAVAKLGVSNRHEAARAARSRGWI